MSEFYIYVHSKPNGDPFYVGKGCSGRGHSKRSHDLIKSRNKHHRAIVGKYGREHILVHVFPCESERDALDSEVAAIAQLRSDGYVLANKTAGGEGSRGFKHSIHTRALMSAKRAGKPRAAETVRKMREAGLMFKKGSAAFAGHKHSPEHLLTLVGNKRALGHKHDEASRQKMREAHARRRDAAMLPKPTNVAPSPEPEEVLQ